MSNPGDADATPIASVRQLADYIAAGCKPQSEYRIGTEHEKFGFDADLHPPAYEPHGIRAVLEGMAAAAPDGWAAILDRGAPIGLRGQGPHRSASVSLEPAGQFELSGGLLADLHATQDEFAAHFAAVRMVAGPLGIGFAPLGHHPTHPRADMPWMPKGRYAIMRRYMPLVGTMGLDMMQRTCTVQVNLDYSSEADMARKLRVSLALQPVATALFANSPFVDGRPSGFLSSRARVWTDTDNARAGMPEAMFNEDFGFERYVEWLIDVPMYFVERDGTYQDVAGASFRDYMAGRHPEIGDGRATMGDFADHMTTVFTDVRLKRFLEMRGADAGRPDMMLAQSALWVGLLYDDAALSAADALVRRYPWDAYRAVRAEVPRAALDAAWAGGTVRDLARDMVAIARDGLRARARRDALGRDESGYLAPLEPLVRGAPTQAEYWLSRYHGPWQGDASRIFAEAAV
ncbi:MAG: glutamate--cysteine ligase [Gemmatimonadaceae bacterium]|nr:glutamate--cysteine ligase [Acetobacteraceae bacterium]